jgi:hypothetical protein
MQSCGVGKRRRGHVCAAAVSHRKRGCGIAGGAGGARPTQVRQPSTDRQRSRRCRLDTLATFRGNIPRPVALAAVQPRELVGQPRGVGRGAGSAPTVGVTTAGEGAAAAAGGARRHSEHRDGAAGKLDGQERHSGRGGTRHPLSASRVVRARATSWPRLRRAARLHAPGNGCSTGEEGHRGGGNSARHCVWGTALVTPARLPAPPDVTAPSTPQQAWQFPHSAFASQHAYE